MNAVFREKDLVVVIPNTDAQLSSLQGSVQDLRVFQSTLLVRLHTTNEGIDKANERIDAVQTTLLVRIDALSTHLSDEIKAVNASLCDKIDKMSEMMEALRKEVLGRFDKQDERIAALDKRIDWVHIGFKVLLAILGLCVSIAAIANALRTFGWI